MKTIDATLSATQKNPNAPPIARASLADNGRLHLARQFTGTWGGGYTRTANCGSFFVRCRTVPIGTMVQYQKITDPTVESQWDAGAWLDLDSNNSGVHALAVFWIGSYVVAAYQDATSKDIVYRRSTDGVTWSSEAAAYTGLAPHNAYLSGASGGSAQSGVMVSYNGQLYWGAYNPAADTWAALNSAGLTMTSATVEGDVAYDAANSRHIFAYAPNGLVRWSRYGLVIQTRSTSGTWGTPRVFIQSDNLGLRYISLSQGKIGNYWYLTFHRQAAWASDVFWLSTSLDGVHWEAPYPTDLDAEGHAEPIGALTGYSGHYLASESFVYLSTAQTFWSNLPVVRYAFTAGATTTRVAGGRAPHLTVVLDNRDGLAATPSLYSQLTLERGFHSAGSDYYVSAGAYYVTGFRYLLDDHLLEVQAIDTLGLLTTFVSDVSFNFEGETVQSLVTLICALAGAHSVSFDGNAIWSDTVEAFTHPANETARLSLDALRERVPFDYTVAEDGTIAFYVPSASPAAAYTYGRGAGQHVYWPGEFGEADGPTYVRVIGSPPRTVGGEDTHQAAIYAAGRAHAAFVLNRQVKTTADADELSAALIVFYTERARAGFFEAPPNFALEAGDVVEFADGHYSDTAGPWRVEQIQELFNPPSGKKLVQRIHLRGTA